MSLSVRPGDWKRSGSGLRRVGSVSTVLREPEWGAVEGAYCLGVDSKNWHSEPHLDSADCWRATVPGLEHSLGLVAEEQSEVVHLLDPLGSSTAWHNTTEQRERERGKDERERGGGGLHSKWFQRIHS